jgi:peptidoglycan/LPS O-acetylase OafA/YrhL
MPFLVIMVLFRMYPIIPHWTSIRMDAIVTVGMAILVVSLRCIGVPMRILSFLGKHSANIYLIHTFYNLYWHLTWLHKGIVMRSGLNFAILLSMCLLSSIVLEWMKEKIGVYKLLSVIKLKLS